MNYKTDSSAYNSDHNGNWVSKITMEMFYDLKFQYEQYHRFEKIQNGRPLTISKYQ